MPDTLIRLPYSAARRGALKYAKLLRRVDPLATSAFAFEGIFFRPGERVPCSQLRPDEGWPEKPVLLECCGPLTHRNGPPTFILWRLEEGTWCELARTTTETDWVYHLAPIAHRAIGERKVDVAGVSRRLVEQFERELRDLSVMEKARLLTVVHDQVAMRAMGIQEEARALQMKALEQPENSQKKDLLNASQGSTVLEMGKKPMSVVEAGRRGGNRRKKTLSAKRRSEISRMGALAKHRKQAAASAANR